MDIFSITSLLLNPNIKEKLIKLKEFLLLLHEDDDLKKKIFRKYPDVEKTIYDLLTLLDIKLDTKK